MAEAREDDNSKDNEKERLKIITAIEESISAKTPFRGLKQKEFIRKTRAEDRNNFDTTLESFNQKRFIRKTRADDKNNLDTTLEKDENEDIQLKKAIEEIISATSTFRVSKQKVINLLPELDDLETTLGNQEEENGSEPPDKETVTHNSQLCRGDAVSFRRRIGPFKYKHHGIVEKIIPESTRFRIIHVTGNSKDLVSSISSNMNTGICSEVIDFTKETDVFKYNFKRSRGDKNPAAVAEMFLDYGLPKEFGFHLLHFNCESFSRYCATGLVYSKQTNHVNKDAKIKLDEIVFKNGKNYK